jgi:tRNA pseudouridine13 synthase
VLAERVTDGSWERLVEGDLANLDGRGSLFAADAADPTLTERCGRLEIHPTGPMWGAGSPATLARVLELETRVGAQFQEESQLCAAAGMAQERRSLRLAVRELESEPEPGACVLHFRLARGSFATAVLRELITDVL